MYILCLSVSLYPKNVKPAKPIGPNFFVGPHMTTGKVYGCQKLQKFVSKSFFFVVKFWKGIKNTFLLLFYNEKMLTDKATIKSLNRRWARSALKAY